MNLIIYNWYLYQRHVLLVCYTPEDVQRTVFVVCDQVIARRRHGNTCRTHQLTGQVTSAAKPKPKVARHSTERLQYTNSETQQTSGSAVAQCFVSVSS